MNVDDQSAVTTPIDGQHHNDPPVDGDKELPTNLQHITDQMLRTDYKPQSDQEYVEIQAVRQLQPSRVRMVMIEMTREVSAKNAADELRSTMNESDEIELKECKEDLEVSNKRPLNEEQASVNTAKSVVTNTKKKCKTGREAEAKDPELYTLDPSFFDSEEFLNKQDANIEPAHAYASGRMIVDGEHKINKMRFIRYLIGQKLKPPENSSWDDMVKTLPKGGLVITIKPENAKKWETLVMNMPSKQKLRCHPPSGSGRNSESSVIVFGVDETVPDDVLIDGLRPRPVSVKRFKRGNTVLNVCKVEYKSKEVATRVITNGWVKYEDHVWLQAEAPKLRTATRYCRTCKKCKLDCNNRRCRNLRCGRCGDNHKTSDCSVEDEKVACLECKSTDHLMFKCPKMVERLAAETKRKKAVRTEKRRRQRQRRAAKKQKENQAAKADDQSDSGKQSYADVVKTGSVNTPTPAVATPMQGLGVTSSDLMDLVVQAFVMVCFPEHDEQTNAKIAEQTLCLLSMRIGKKVEDEQMVVMQIDESGTTAPLTENKSDTESHVPIESSMCIDIDESKAIIDDDVQSPTDEVQSPTLISAIESHQQLSINYFVNRRMPGTAAVTCGCNNLFKPKGFGSHKKSCQKWTEAMVQL